MKFKKQNGFPTRYGYACGYGEVFEGPRGRVSIFECDSHTCIDVRGTIEGVPFWDQFYHCDNGDGFNAITEAEKAFRRYRRQIANN